MSKPTLEESLKYFSQHEPHYSVILDYVDSVKNASVTSLCHSVANDKDTSVDRFYIGQISALEHIVDILSEHKIRKN